MKERLYAFDFLRAFMMLLGVFLHGLLFEPEISFLDNTWSNRVMTLLAEVIHTFRMPLFFCLSGFMASQLFGKLGVRAFCVNRFRRLFIPFVLSLFTIGLLSNLFHHSLVLHNRDLHVLNTLKTSFSLRYFNFEDIEPIHLWFLYYLSAFIPAILLVTLIVRRLPLTKIKNGVNRISRQPGSRPIAIVVLAFIPTVLLFYSGHNGNPTPRSFVMKLENFLPYFYYFSFGWCIHRIRFSLQYFVSQAAWFLVAALFLSAVRLVAWGLLDEKNIFVNISYNLSLWCYIFGFLGVVQVYCNKPSALVQYFSDASYWIYLVHYPIIVGLKLLFYEPTTLLTFSFLLLLTLLLSVVSYNYLVRPTLIGKLLNGKTQPPQSIRKLQPMNELVMQTNRNPQTQKGKYVIKYYRFSRSKNVQRL